MQQKGEHFWEEKINRVGSIGTYMYFSASQRFRPGMQLGSRAQGLYCHPPPRKTGCAWSGRCVWASRQPIGALYRVSLISTSPWPCGRNPGGRSRLLCIPARRSEPESLASRSQSPTLSPLAPLRSLLLCSAMLSCCSARPYIRLPKSSFELSKLTDLRTDQLARSLFFVQSIPSPSIWSFSLPLLCRDRKHSTRVAAGKFRFSILSNPRNWQASNAKKELE